MSFLCDSGGRNGSTMLTVAFCHSCSAFMNAGGGNRQVPGKNDDESWPSIQDSTRNNADQGPAYEMASSVIMGGRSSQSSAEGARRNELIKAYQKRHQHTETHADSTQHKQTSAYELAGPGFMGDKQVTPAQAADVASSGAAYEMAGPGMLGGAPVRPLEHTQNAAAGGGGASVYELAGPNLLGRLSWFLAIMVAVSKSFVTKDEGATGAAVVFCLNLLPEHPSPNV